MTKVNIDELRAQNIVQNPLENKTRQKEDRYDLDLKLSSEDLGDKPVDCTSETCNCKTRACRTYNYCPTASCQCPSRYCSGRTTCCR